MQTLPALVNDLAIEPELSGRLQDILSHRRSKNTLRTYAAQWRKWLAFCDYKSKDIYPANPADIVQFIVEAHDKGIAKSTISTFLTVIRLAHTGEPVNPADHLVVKETMLAIRRKDTRPPNRAVAMSLEALTVINQAITQPQTTQTFRNRALLCVGFFGALRASELVALKWSDLRKCSQGYEVTITTSKTDQESHGKILGLPLLPDDYKDVCPARALVWHRHEFKRSCHIDVKPVDGYVFRPLSYPKDPDKHLSTRAVSKVIRSCEVLAGLNEGFTSHSLRRGFATLAAKKGASSNAIMKHGRWRSRAVLDGYIESGRLWEDNVIVSIL